MFDPRDVKSFRFVTYDFDIDSGQSCFEYAFDDTHTFVETIDFPIPPNGIVNPEAFDRALFLLSLVAGISYYKAAVPSTLIVESGAVTKSELEVLYQIYRHGLGEFAYVNRKRLDPTFQTDTIDTREIEEIIADRGALVAVGGGKDSCVSIELLRDGPIPITLASVNQLSPIMEVINAADLPSLHVIRRLAPELLELNAEGAYNGHVPVTAVVSLTLAALAALWGFGDVVMSNERSASIGNTDWNGEHINHQWSKSFDAEILLHDLIAGSIAPNLNYFSLLRPLSELEIVRRFAKLNRYHDVFTSCNGAFRIDESRRVQRWCRDCPKCRFVFLAMAPFMNPTRLSGIFGGDMLRDESQRDGFYALIGWNAMKPFECVGEVEESVAAFKMLTENIAWRDHELVEDFERYVLPEVILPQGLLTKPFILSNDSCIPNEYQELLHESE